MNLNEHIHRIKTLMSLNKNRYPLDESTKYQDTALDNLLKKGGFEKLSDLDKLALLGGSNDPKLRNINLSKIYEENGGTFGMLEIEVTVKDLPEQKIKHRFSQESAGKTGWLYPYIHYTDDNQEYVTVRFNEFEANDKHVGGGNYKQLPIMLHNLYPTDYKEIKSEFVKYQDKVDSERDEFKKKWDNLFNGEEID